MSNDFNKMVEHWQIGSKLVDAIRLDNPYYWIITDIDKTEGVVRVDAYEFCNNKKYAECGEFYIEELDIKLAESRVKPTKLAKKIYPNAKEEDGWLIIEN